jgi:hypothetical protein
MPVYNYKRSARVLAETAPPYPSNPVMAEPRPGHLEPAPICERCSPVSGHLMGHAWAVRQQLRV